MGSKCRKTKFCLPWLFSIEILTLFLAICLCSPNTSTKERFLPVSNSEINRSSYFSSVLALSKEVFGASNNYAAQELVFLDSVPANPEPLLQILKNSRRNVFTYLYLKNVSSLLSASPSTPDIVHYFYRSAEKNSEPKHTHKVWQGTCPAPYHLYKKIISLRGIALLSHVVIVKNTEEKNELHSTFGVPLQKILAAEESAPPATPPAASSRALPSLKGLRDGLYVLYSDTNIHINSDIAAGRLCALWVRTVKETPIKTKKHCSKGPLLRKMHESFLYIAKDNVKISTKHPDVIEVFEKTVVINTPGLSFLIRTDTLAVETRGDLRAPKGRGLICTKAPQNRKKWRLKNPLNKFGANHPFLVFSVGGHPKTLYNLPRRFEKESFDHICKKSSLSRVYVTGYFKLSGIGTVSTKFVLELSADQRLCVRCRTDTHMSAVANNPSEENFEKVLLYTYLFETDQLQNNSPLISNRFRTRGLEIRNTFPIDLSRNIPTYALMMHFPWEFSHIPKAWIDPLRKRGVEIFVPSLFTKSCHIRSGVEKHKVTVVQHGVSYHSLNLMREIEEKDPRLSPRVLFKSPRHFTRFVVINGALERKGIHFAIRAYAGAFTRADRVILRIHCSYGDPDTLKKIKDMIKKNKEEKGPRIVFTMSEKSEKEIRGLLASAHYNLSPYRGEGFGLSILEGMALGTVPIVTNCRPATEFCDKSCAFLIPCKKTKCKSSPVKITQKGITMFGERLESYPYWMTPSCKALEKILQKAHAIRTTDKKKHAEMQKRGREIAKTYEWRFKLEKLVAHILNLLNKKSRAGAEE